MLLFMNDLKNIQLSEPIKKLLIKLVIKYICSSTKLNNILC